MYRKKSIAILMIFCMVLSIFAFPVNVNAQENQTEPQTETQGATVIDAMQFGVDPSGSRDSMPAIRKLIAAAKEMEGPVILDFPKGEYQIYPDKAFEKELYMSNTVGADQNYKMKKIGFLFEDMQDVTLEGNGSLFMFHGAMTTYATIDSQNIKFHNFEFDFAVPTVFDITVESVEGDTAVLYVPECYNYGIEGNTLTWSSDKSPYTGETYWSNTVDNTKSTQIYNARIGQTWRDNNHVFQNVNWIEDIGNNRLKFHYWGNSVLTPGNCYQIRSYTRDHVGMFFWKSKDITLEEVDVRFMHGFGILGQSSENITLRNMDFAAREGTGRTTVGFADFIHMSGCKGQILVEGCSFSNPHDDPINIHGTFNQVTERISDRQFKVRFMHYQTAGFPNFFVGDEVEFFNKGDLTPVANSTAKVVAVSGPTGYSGASDSGTGSLEDMIITLDRDMPQGIWANDYVIENVTYTPSVLIQNNIFKETPTRGILVTTRKPVVIKDNLFDGMNMASIYISDDANDWYESGMVRDVTIENNIFRRPTPYHAAIFIEPLNWVVSTETMIHENINIRNNVFYMENGQVLNAKSVGGLNFTDNKIYRYEPNVAVDLEMSKVSLKAGESAKLTGNAGGKIYTSDLFSFNGCREVTLSGNLYDGGLKLGGSIANMSRSDITMGPDENISIGGNAVTLPSVEKISYESSDDSIVQVTSAGVAVGLREGTAKVRACATAAGRKFVSDWRTIIVSGTAENMPTSLSVSGGKDFSNQYGEKIQYNAQADADTSITWSVVDADTQSTSTHASIDRNGKLMTISDGAVEVVATAANGLEARKLLVISKDGARLASGWEILEEDTAGWEIAGENQIRIYTQPRGIWTDWQQMPKNIFLNMSEGNLENVTATIRMNGKTLGEYEEAGLLFYKDADNYVTIQRKHRNGDPKIVMVTETNGAGNEQSADNVEQEDVWFKLEKRENTVTGYYSTDGNNWTKAADYTDQTQLGNSFKIGFITGNGTEDSTARTPFTFSEFTINGEKVALTEFNTAPSASEVSCDDTEGKLNAAWNFSDAEDDAEGKTLVKWMASQEADGNYTLVPGVTGNSISPTQSMAGKYVKAVVIPQDVHGHYGIQAFSAPIKIADTVTGGTPAADSSETSLASAVFEGVKAFPAFDSSEIFYFTTAGISEDTVTANLKARDDRAILEISVNGKECISREEKKDEVKQLSAKLVPGFNVIQVKVLAEDGESWSDYRFVIARAGDSSCALTGIKLDGEEIPGFSADTLEYSYEVQRNARTLPIEVQASENAEVEIWTNGVCEEAAATTAQLLPGSNDLYIRVNAETLDLRKDYHIEVFVPDDEGAGLRSLSFGEGVTLDEEFVSGTLIYTGTANTSETSLAVQADEEASAIEVIRNGRSLEKGTGSLNVGQIPLTAGKNKICVNVTSPDKSMIKTYELNLEGSGDTYMNFAPESASGWNSIQQNKSVEGNPIRLRMEKGDVKTFENGVGGHAPMTLVYNIDGMGFTKFSAYLGVDQEAPEADKPSIKFAIYLDDDLEHPVWTSGDERMTYYTPAKFAEVSVKDSRKVTITAECGESMDSAHVSLGDVKFTAEMPEPEKADEAVQAVIEKINALGSITLESEAVIADAKKAYEALTEEQKRAVTNYALLEKAEADYSNLKKAEEESRADEKAAEAVIEKIQKIGTVSLSSKDAIASARAAYDALTDAQKRLVKNFGLLTKAEAEYRKLENPESPNKPEGLKKGGVCKAGKLYYKVLSVEKAEVTVLKPVKKTEKAIKIPNTVKLNGVLCKVTQISKNAFKNNKKLTKVTIGKHVQVIGKNAFNGDKKLKKIVIKSKKLKKAYASSIKGISKKAVIDVPNSKRKVYRKLFGIKAGSSVKVK